MSSALSPNNFFNTNGKYAPITLDINAPDILKPVTSITEVATIGYVSSVFVNTSIYQSTQKVSKSSPFNFSKQISFDCRLEVILNDGKKIIFFVDSKTMNLSTLSKRLNNLSHFNSGDKLECNFYFVGGLKKTHIFSFYETKGIVRVMHDRCTELYNTNDPVAISFVNQNISNINKFSSSGSLADLQKSQIGPFLFGQENFGPWFNSLFKF